MSKSQDSPKPSAGSKRKRRWPKVILILLALLVAFGFALNGPIARWLVGKTLREKLAEQGLSGEVTVEGHLHHGFTLRDGNFSGTGTGAIEKLRFDEITVGYRIPDLLEKKVERLAIRNLVATVDLTALPKKPEKEEGRKLPDFHGIGETLRTIRPLVLPVDLDLQEIDLTLERPPKDPLTIAFEALRHHPGQDTIAFEQFESNALGDEGLRRQDLVLTWEEERIGLERAQLIPDLAVDSFVLDLPTTGIASCQAHVEALATNLLVQADESGKVQVALEDRPLDLSRLDYFPDLELEGTIEQLTIDAEHLLQAPSEWRGTIDLRGSDLAWPNGKLQSVQAACVLGEETRLRTSLSGGLQLEATARHPAKKSDDPKEWLDDLAVTFELSAPSLHTALQHLLPAAGQDLPDLDQIPEGAVGAEGQVTFGAEKVVARATTDWTFSKIVFREQSVPDLAGTASLQDDLAAATVRLAQPRPEEKIEVKVNLGLEDKNYNAALKANLPDPAWLLPFLPKQEDPLWKPTGPIALEWSGNGQLTEEASHRGNLQIGTLTLTAPEDTKTEIAFQGNYAWPGRVEATSLSIRNGDLWLEGALEWDQDRLTVSTLHFHDLTGPLAGLEGALPLALEALSAEKFLAQEGALDLTLDGHDLKLGRVAKLLPLKLPEGFDATFDYDLRLGGTPAAPTLGGEFSATGVTTPGPEEVPPLDANLTFATAGQRLTATGTITEPGGELVSFSATLPLQPKKWIEDPEEFGKLPVDAQARINDFALQRLHRFVPALAQAEGALAVDLRASGAVRKPTLAGNATLTLDRYPLKNTPYREIRDSHLAIALDGSRLVIRSSEINCAGGKITLSGSVGLANDEPDFDLRVLADHVLVWRDESAVLRSNGQLALDGPLGTARLTGNFEIVESLFYKDIELIPYGLPAESVPDVELPSIDQEQASQGVAALPAPFDSWAVDVAIRTADPLLIRGNLATGRIECNARVRGTLSSPRPEGTVNIRDTEAILPFSRLVVKEGAVNLRPDAPYNPRLDVRGTSQVDDYHISLRLYGPVSSPSYEVFSTPPLPESEILTLLATGTTSEGLEDTGAAAMKALQLFLTDLRKRAARPGGNARFLRLLDGLDAVDLDFSENDRFTGRKFTSASMRVSKSDQWYLSAGVDRDGHTRGLLTFKFQLRELFKKGAELPQLPRLPGLPHFTTSAAQSAKKVTTIRIRGLRLMPEEKALDLLAGRLEFALERPPSVSRADDAAYVLERLLLRHGYADPRVDWTLPGSNLIDLKVEEGPRYELRRVNVRGTGPDEVREIGALFRATHLGETPQRRLLARSGDVSVPYLPPRNPVARKKAEDLLNSKGYWDATVTVEPPRLPKSPAGGPVDLNIDVKKGPVFTLAPVLVETADEFGPALRNKLAKLHDRPATTHNIKSARATVERFYRKKGFTHARVEMFAAQRGDTLQLRLRISQGKKFRVGEVRVEGAQRTKPERITDRFKEYPGETYDPDAVRDEIRDLFGTGAFQGMQLEEIPQRDGTLDLLLRVREPETAPDGYFSYVGVGSYEGPFVGGGYYHRNLYGNLWNLSTGFEFSALGLLGDVRVTDPWFLGYDLRFTPRAFLLTRKYEGYTKFQGGFGAELEWDLANHWPVRDWVEAGRTKGDWSAGVEALWSYVTLGNDFTPALPSDELGTSDYLLQSLGLRITWDDRNEKALPTDGHFLEVRGEAGFVVGQESVSFLRAEGQLSVYEPVFEEGSEVISNLAIGARAGVIVPSASDNDLPVDLRYFLGGADTIRSFPARELGPEAVNGIPRGGEAYWVANAEYIHRIVGPLRGVVFLDAGSLSPDHGTLFSEEIKFAAGIGLRLDLPVGPVRFEYGHGIFNDPDDPDGAFHFAIGATF